jgi:phosphoribosylglycinamide formyltransferase-1
MNIAVLISGFGSNLQALIDAQSLYSYRIALVISDQADAYGLERAKQAGIAHQLIERAHYPDKLHFFKAIQTALEAAQIELIVLAGFMRILPAEFIRNAPGPIINIHPSLLPAYPGLNTHERVFAAKETVHGVTVHLVDEGVDTGPIIAQERFQIETPDDPNSLKQKVHQLEHQLLPAVIAAFAERRLSCHNQQIQYCGQIQSAPLCLQDLRA